MRKSRMNGRRFCARVGAACAPWALLAAPVLAQNWSNDAGAPGVSVSNLGTVDLAVQDTDLAQVLEMLSIQGRKNIITSKNVSATVSANLYDVTFYEALEAILSVNGYGYIEEGNFIYIYTQEELAEVEKNSRRTESRIYALEYLSAADATEFIAPLLSEAGKASARGDVQQGFQPDVSDGGADSYAYEAKLVVNDYQENMEAIANLLDELDTPPQQVLIEATILQTTLDESNAWGVDFSAITDMDFTDLTNPLAPVTNLLNGNDATDGFQPPANVGGGLQSTVGNTKGPAGFKVGYINDEFSVFLRLLDEVTDVTVLARPKIMALNRQRAEVLVGARVGYLSTTSTQTTTTQTVQFLDTGIHLIFRPFLSKNGMIRLELSPSVSEASLRTVTDAQGLQVTIPDELTNELTTNVRIHDGQTLVLGGLFRESTRLTQRQVPWVGDIPLIGAAFTGQDDVIDRDEIIFLITPSIVHDDVLAAAGDEAMSFIDGIRVGARTGLLPWGREKVASNYNQRAMTAFHAGDLNRALHWTNTSLRLNPNQPQMAKLRADLTGKKQRAFDASIMERAFRSQLGPLPKEKALLPRQVAVLGGGAGEPATWVGPAVPPRNVRSEPRQAATTPADPERSQQQASATPATAQPGAPAQGPTAAAGVTEFMPRVLPDQGFWRAGGNPAAIDDPAWNQPFPFITFEDVLDPGPPKGN